MENLIRQANLHNGHSSDKSSNKTTESGFALFIMVALILGMSIAGVATFRAAGQFYKVTAGATSGVSRQALMDRVPFFCAQIGARYSSAVTEIDESSLNVAGFVMDGRLTDSAIKSTLEHDKKDGHNGVYTGILDFVGDASTFSLFSSPIDSLRKGDSGVFIDVDYDGKFISGSTGGLVNYGKNVTDCVGQGQCARYDDLRLQSDTGETDEDPDIFRGNYDLFVCEVYFQKYEHMDLTASVPVLDRNNPYDALVVNYKFDSIKGTPSNF